MQTHEVAKLLLERPDGKLTISIDISNGEPDAFNRVFGDYLFGWQRDTNPSDTVLLLEGVLST